MEPDGSSVSETRQAGSTSTGVVAVDAPPCSPTDEGDAGGVVVVLVAVGLSGILGGLASVFFRADWRRRDIKDVIAGMIRGLVAALTVPLFLETVSSPLVENVARDGGISSAIVLCGYCVLAGVFADAFVRAVYILVLRERDPNSEPPKGGSE